MPRKLWWEHAKSRRGALTGAVVFSLLLVVVGYLLIKDLVEWDGDFWQLAFRIVVVLAGIFLAAAFWTNWHKLRSGQPGKQ